MNTERESYVAAGERIREEADRETWEKFGATLELLINLQSAIGVAINAIQENTHLRMDRDYWRAEHAKVLNESIRHGETMMGHLLMATLEGGIHPKEKHDR